MNIAFYINELNLQEENLKIYECLNKAVDSKLFTDVCLFVNNINFMDKPTKFGIFNSTEIWNYTGALVTVDMVNTAFTSRVVNRFKNYYCYFKGKEHAFQVISAANNKPVFVTSEEDQKELYRITGKNFPVIKLTPEDLYSNIEV
jgi:hypothetical protein